MNPKGLWLTRGLVFIACIFFGRWFGQSLFTKEIDAVENLLLPKVPEAVLIPEALPQTLLLVQYDHRSQSNLRAIWQIQLDPGTSPQWVLLYPTAEQPALDAVFQNRFQIIKSVAGSEPLLQPAPEFIAFLHGMKYTWDEIMLLDDFALENLVDWLGGIKPNNSIETQNGGEILANLRDVNLTNARLFHYQHSLWREICWKLYQIAQPTILDQLIALQPNHVILHPAQSAVLSLWKDQLQNQKHPYCEFPLYEEFQIKYLLEK